MTLSDLLREVTALLPDDCRVEVQLTLRRLAPAYYVKDRREVLAEVFVWYHGRYAGIDAPTYEAALEKFKTVLLPELGLEAVPPVEERLAAMDVNDILLTE